MHVYIELDGRMLKQVLSAAIRLTLKFLNEEDIPGRFTGKKGKPETEEKREQIFQKNVSVCEKTIKMILTKVENQQAAWRFINLSPIIEPGIKGVTYCKDFRDFTNYLILRRDIEKCDNDELGWLVLLHTTFQGEIEKQLSG